MRWTGKEASPPMDLIASCLLLPTTSLPSPLWKMKLWVFLEIESWTERKRKLANSPEFSRVFQKPGFSQTWNLEAAGRAMCCLVAMSKNYTSSWEARLAPWTSRGGATGGWAPGTTARLTIAIPLPAEVWPWPPACLAEVQMSCLPLASPCP